MGDKKDKKGVGRPEKSVMEKRFRQWVSLPYLIAQRWPSEKIEKLVIDTDGGVVVTAPASSDESVKSKVEQLREAMAGKVVKASELSEDTFKVADKPRELPFGETPKSLPRLMSPQHQALLDRFVGILKHSTPEGVKAISSQLLQWEELMEF